MKQISKDKIFLSNYFTNVIKVIQDININKLNKITEVLLNSIKKKKKYLCSWKWWISFDSQPFIM